MINKNINVSKPIKIDRTRISRVLNNLVSNAIKYNDLSKEQPTVDINAKLEDNTLILNVSDSGKGIRDEIKDRVFDMFYRGTDQATGSGLGLYIAREMMHKMDGTLKFSTEAGKGTTFTLVLPLSQAKKSQ